jgi:hypothetical protein
VDCSRLALDAVVRCTAVSKNKVSSVQRFAADNRDDAIPYISNLQHRLGIAVCKEQFRTDVEKLVLRSCLDSLLRG